VSGKVGSRLINLQSAGSFKTKKNVRYVQPTPSPFNASPVYPNTLLAKDLPPITIKVRVIVDRLGDVTNVIPLERESNDNFLFIQCIRSAVMKWKFNPLVKVVRGPGQTTLVDTFGSKTTFSGLAVALPFHQDYQFTFHVSDPKARGSVH